MPIKKHDTERTLMLILVIGCCAMSILYAMGMWAGIIGSITIVSIDKHTELKKVILPTQEIQTQTTTIIEKPVIQTYNTTNNQIITPPPQWDCITLTNSDTNKKTLECTKI